MKPKHLSLVTALLLALPTAFAAEEVIEGPIHATSILMRSSGPSNLEPLTTAFGPDVYCRHDDESPGSEFQLHRFFVAADPAAGTAELRFHRFFAHRDDWVGWYSEEGAPIEVDEQLRLSGAAVAVKKLADKPQGLYMRFRFTVEKTISADDPGIVHDPDWQFDTSHQINAFYMAWRRPSLKGVAALTQKTRHIPTDTTATCFHSWTMNGGGGMVEDPTLYREGGIINLIKSWVRSQVTNGYDATKSRNVGRVTGIGVRG